MQLSARNQLNGTVRSVELGAVMAEVVVDVDGQQIVSAITRSSAERLGLAPLSPARLANPFDWIVAGEAYAQLHEESPTRTPSAGITSL